MLPLLMIHPVNSPNPNGPSTVNRFHFAHLLGQLAFFVLSLSLSLSFLYCTKMMFIYSEGTEKKSIIEWLYMHGDFFLFWVNSHFPTRDAMNPCQIRMSILVLYLLQTF